MINKNFYYNLKVQFEDCDLQQIVHNSKINCYLERARFNLLDTENLSYNKLINKNIGFVMTDMKIKYVKPIFFNDEVVIITSITGIYYHCLKVTQIVIKKEAYKLIKLLNFNLVDDFSKIDDILVFCNTKFSLIDLNNKQPVNKNNEILKIINKDNQKFSVKDLHFKHPLI